MTGCLNSSIPKKVVIELPLPGFTSLCQPKAKVIVSKDRGGSQVHRANNVNSYEVAHYRIDDVVIKDGKKCDYLLLNEDKRVAYFIELKGQDLTWAAQQIEATEITLRDSLSNYPDRRYRIVANKCRTHNIEHSGFKKYRDKWYGRLRYESLRIEEDL